MWKKVATISKDCSTDLTNYQYPCWSTDGGGSDTRNRARSTDSSVISISCSALVDPTVTNCGIAYDQWDAEMGRIVARRRLGTKVYLLVYYALCIYNTSKYWTATVETVPCLSRTSFKKPVQTMQNNFQNNMITSLYGKFSQCMYVLYITSYIVCLWQLHNGL